MQEYTILIEYKFLPPYSPFINPIEYAFNVVKEAVAQSTVHNRGELIRVILEKNQLITGEHAKKFIEKSLSFYPHIAEGKPFTGKPLDPIVPQFHVDVDVSNTITVTNQETQSLPWY